MYCLFWQQSCFCCLKYILLVNDCKNCMFELSKQQMKEVIAVCNLISIHCMHTNQWLGYMYHSENTDTFYLLKTVVNQLNIKVALYNQWLGYMHHSENTDTVHSTCNWLLWTSCNIKVAIYNKPYTINCHVSQ